MFRVFVTSVILWPCVLSSVANTDEGIAGSSLEGRAESVLIDKSGQFAAGGRKLVRRHETSVYAPDKVAELNDLTEESSEDANGDGDGDGAYSGLSSPGQTASGANQQDVMDGLACDGQ